jgi:hypothetical protein
VRRCPAARWQAKAVLRVWSLVAQKSGRVWNEVLHDFLFDPKLIPLKIREIVKDFPDGNSSSARTLLWHREDEVFPAGPQGKKERGGWLGYLGENGVLVHASLENRRSFLKSKPL